MALTGLDIYKLLPKTNCKKCGLPTCMAFGVGLLNREKKIEDCPPLIEEQKYEAKLKKLPTMAYTFSQPIEFRMMELIEGVGSLRQDTSAADAGDDSGSPKIEIAAARIFQQQIRRRRVAVLAGIGFDFRRGAFDDVARLLEGQADPHTERFVVFDDQDPIRHSSASPGS